MTDFERGRQSGIVSGLRLAIAAVLAMQDNAQTTRLATAAARRLRRMTYRKAAREINALLAVAGEGRPILRNRRDCG